MPSFMILLLCGVVVGLILLVGSLSRAGVSRKSQRLSMLQQALEHPQLDAQTRAEILRVLTREHSGGGLRFLLSAAFWERLLFAVGWLTFLLFGGRWVGAQLGVFSRYQMDTCMVFGLLGLALMSLPIAMHEFVRRTRTVAVEQ